MKTKKVLSSLIILGIVLGSQVYAQSFAGHQNGQMRETPPGLELPDDWDDMTEDERHEYMEANRPDDIPEQGQRGNTPPNMELPDDWDDMTEDERHEYMETNRPKTNEDGKIQPRSTNIKTTKNARKARNYQKFTGNLVAAKTFSDESNIKNKEAVQMLQQRGIIDGNADGSFQPQKGINRAESLKVILEALKIDSEYTNDAGFSDVNSSDWFAKYVNIAKNKGIVKGYEDGTFKPGATVTQAELLKISFESFGINLSDYNAGDYTDQWYGSYLQYALDNNLINSATPGTPMTRDEFSEFVYRLIQQQENL